MKEMKRDPAGGATSQPAPSSAPHAFPEKARELARRLAAGESLSIAARSVGVSTSQASSWVSRPDFEQLLMECLPTTDEVRNLFYKEAARSARVLAEIRDKAAKDRDRLDAAKEILRQAGFTPIQRIATVTFRIPLDREKQMAETAKELGWAVEPFETGEKK